MLEFWSVLFVTVIDLGQLSLQCSVLRSVWCPSVDLFGHDNKTKEIENEKEEKNRKPKKNAAT